LFLQSILNSNVVVVLREVVLTAAEGPCQE
jgi:hypothetical protein